MVTYLGVILTYNMLRASFLREFNKCDELLLKIGGSTIIYMFLFTECLACMLKTSSNLRKIANQINKLVDENKENI